MVKLGVTLPQFTDDPAVVVDGAHRAREAGLDSVFVFDHLWPLTGGKERPLFESWTTLAHVASVTDTMDIGTLVDAIVVAAPSGAGEDGGDGGIDRPGEADRRDRVGGRDEPAGERVVRHPVLRRVTIECRR